MAIADTAKLVASLELQDKFTKPLAGAGRSLDTFATKAKALDKLGNDIGRGLRNTAQNIGRLGLIAGGLAVGGLVASINAASDLNESVNKADVVFGKFAARVHAFGQTAASSLGLSRQQAEEAASSFGNLFAVTGLTADVSADMSIKLVKLAGDLASFNNIDPSEALLKLRSGLVGEAEPLRSVGILLTEAAVQEEAYASGIAERGKKLTEAQKVQARYNLILKQSGTAQGDFARTSSGLANQQRILKAQLTDTAAVIGTALLPTVNKLLLQFTTLLKNNQPEIQKFADSLPGVASRVEAVLGGLPWDTIGGAFKLMGSGAKLALEAFEAAPPWLQTAVLTGWGLNKLTGGALGSIAVDLGKLIFTRGSTPANPLFVSQVGGIGGGPGGGIPAAGGFGSLLLRFLGVGGAVVGGALLGNAIARPTFDRTVAPAVKFEQSQFDKLIASQDPAKLRSGLDAINTGLQQLGNDNLLGRAIAGDQIGVLEDQRKLLIDQIHTIEATQTLSDRLAAARSAEIQAAQSTAAARTLDQLRAQSSSLIRIEEKKFDPTVNVNVAATANISVSNVSRTLTSFRIAGTTTVGGFTESAF